MQTPMPAVAMLMAASARWAAVLLPAAIKTSILLAGAGIVCAGLRRAAALRHLVWALALAATLLLPCLSPLLPAWTPPIPRSRSLGLQSLQILAMPGVPDSRAAATDNAAWRPGPPSRAARAGRPVAPGAAPPAALAAKTSAPAASEISPPRASSVPAVASALWLAGTLLLLGRRLRASRRLRLLARRSLAPPHPGWQALLDRQARELGVRRPVRLLLSSESDVPLTWGVIAPRVLLPAAATGWTEQRLTVVLLHELAHVRRFDFLTRWLAQLSCALYWWNPLVWLAARRLYAAAECACDDQVLGAGARPSQYAGDLLQIAAAIRTRPAVATTPADAGIEAAALAMARRSHLEARLTAILDPRHRRRSVGALGGALALLGCVSSLLPIAALQPAALTEPGERGERGPAPAQPPPSANSLPQLQRLAGPPGGSRLAGLMDAAVLQPAPGTAPGPTASDVELCRPGKHGQNVSYSINGRRKLTVTWTGDDCSVELRAEGATFDPELSGGVTSIAADGYVDFSVRQGGTVRRLQLRPAAGAGLQRTWTVNGRELAYGPEAASWLASLLLALERRTAFAVETRVPRLLARGGPDAVLNEISQMGSDYARSAYFHKLLDSAPLDEPTLRRIVAQAGAEIASDYELARVLSTVAGDGPQAGASAQPPPSGNSLPQPRRLAGGRPGPMHPTDFPLASAENQAAFLAALDHLKSDYEHARVLMILIERRDLSPSLAATALRSASRLHSDYELGRVLVALAQSRLVREPAVQRAYLDAAANLKSDYERSRALQALLASGRLSGEAALQLIHLAEGLHGNYEKANVLIAVMTSVSLDGPVREELLRAARGLSSEYDRRRVLDQLPQPRQ